MKTPIRAATVFLVGLTLVLSNVSIASAAASTGYLDRTFSDDGKAVTNVAGDDTGEAMAIQADGKIVVAGTANGGTDIAVVRYDTDGTLDGTFGGGDGKVVTDISGDDAAFAIAIQGDQKILVGGFADGTLEAALLRYDTGGALDSSFGGGDGIVLTPVGMGAVYEDLVVQPDDAILAGGTMTPDGIKGAFLAVRYDSAGTPDATFGGGDGIQTTTVGASGGYATGIALQGDGSAILVGTTVSGTGNENVELVRYDSSGTLDTTFGVAASGKVTTDVGSGPDEAMSSSRATGRSWSSGAPTSPRARSFATPPTAPSTRASAATARSSPSWAGSVATPRWPCSRMTGSSPPAKVCSRVSTSPRTRTP